MTVTETESDLIRFVDAQAQVYSQVVAELTDGHKRTHWMWFIFPQLSADAQGKGRCECRLDGIFEKDNSSDSDVMGLG